MANEFVYGKNACMSLLKNRKDFINVYLQKNYLDTKIIGELEKNRIKFKYVERKVLDNLTNNGLHQGIVMEVEGYDYLSVDELLDKVSLFKEDDQLIVKLKMQGYSANEIFKMTGFNMRKISYILSKVKKI